MRAIEVIVKQADLEAGSLSAESAAFPQAGLACGIVVAVEASFPFDSSSLVKSAGLVGSLARVGTAAGACKSQGKAVS